MDYLIFLFEFFGPLVAVAVGTASSLAWLSCWQRALGVAAGLLAVALFGAAFIFVKAAPSPQAPLLLLLVNGVVVIPAFVIQIVILVIRDIDRYKGLKGK